MTSVSVAVSQFAPGTDREANRQHLRRTVGTAGTRVVIFPEYSSYFENPLGPGLDANAESLSGPFVESMIAAAKDHDAVVVAGMVESAEGAEGAEGARVHNTVVAVDATGVLAAYRKVHLYDAFGERESQWIAPGEVGAAAVFVVDGVRFGLMTCYDLRFPEVSRVLADAAVGAIVVPSEWVRGPLKEHHWNTLLAARAIENTAYVIAADHPGPIGVGLSQILDPRGVVLAGTANGPGLARAEVDTETIASVRRVNPVLALRRYQVVSLTS